MRRAPEPAASNRTGEAGSKSRASSAEGNALARAIRFKLDEALWVDFDLHSIQPDGLERQLLARVYFPDDAKGMLELLCWGGAYRIVDTIFEIGAAYVAQYLGTHGARGADGGGNDDGGRHPTVILVMPLRFFRVRLEAIRAGGPEPGPEA